MPVIRLRSSLADRRQSRADVKTVIRNYGPIQRTIFILLADIDAVKHQSDHADYKYRDQHSILLSLSLLIQQYSLTDMGRKYKTSRMLGAKSLKTKLEQLLKPSRKGRNFEDPGQAVWSHGSSAVCEDYLEKIRDSYDDYTLHSGLPTAGSFAHVCLQKQVESALSGLGPRRLTLGMSSSSNEHCFDCSGQSHLVIWQSSNLFIEIMPMKMHSKFAPSSPSIDAEQGGTTPATTHRNSSGFVGVDNMSTSSVSSEEAVRSFVIQQESIRHSVVVPLPIQAHDTTVSATIQQITAMSAPSAGSSEGTSVSDDSGRREAKSVSDDSGSRETSIIELLSPPKDRDRSAPASLDQKASLDMATLLSARRMSLKNNTSRPTGSTSQRNEARVKADVESLLSPPISQSRKREASTTSIRLRFPSSKLQKQNTKAENTMLAHEESPRASSIIPSEETLPHQFLRNNIKSIPNTIESRSSQRRKEVPEIVSQSEDHESRPERLRAARPASAASNHNLDLNQLRTLVNDLSVQSQDLITNFFISISLPHANRHDSPFAPSATCNIKALFRKCWGSDWILEYTKLHERQEVSSHNCLRTLISAFIHDRILMDGHALQPEMYEEIGLRGNEGECRSATYFQRRPLTHNRGSSDHVWPSVARSRSQ